MNSIIRNPPNPCFCGHSLRAHTVAAFEVNPLPAMLSTVPQIGRAAATLYVRYAWINPAGTTLASTEQSIAYPINTTPMVTPFPPPNSAIAFAIYASATTGTETLQATVAINGDQLYPLDRTIESWILPTTGLVAGAALPGSNTAALLTCFECRLANASDAHSFGPNPPLSVSPGVLDSGR